MRGLAEGLAGEGIHDQGVPAAVGPGIGGESRAVTGFPDHPRRRLRQNRQRTQAQREN